MPSILLVEDHKVMAETLVRILRTKGNFEVADVAESAEDALEWLSGRESNSQVDLALVDVVLPRTSGIELVSKIQQRYPGLPCLMISGRSNGQYVSRSLAAGARGYVLKDDLHEVMTGVQHVLEGGTYLSKQLSSEE
ncbi:MAG TPA: response regulator transcription factor [Anaerolineales bacterium]|nr:response regulator transcription factor [Anaerolineales bacterium]